MEVGILSSRQQWVGQQAELKLKKLAWIFGKKIKLRLV